MRTDDQRGPGNQKSGDSFSRQGFLLKYIAYLYRQFVQLIQVRFRLRREIADHHELHDSVSPAADLPHRVKDLLFRKVLGHEVAQTLGSSFHAEGDSSSLLHGNKAAEFRIVMKPVHPQGCESDFISECAAQIPYNLINLGMRDRIEGDRGEKGVPRFPYDLPGVFPDQRRASRPERQRSETTHAERTLSFAAS